MYYDFYEFYKITLNVGRHLGFWPPC